MKYFSIIILALLVAATACKKTDNESQASIDDKMIQDYLSTNNINATKHESGLYYVIHVPGSGGSPDINSNVEVKYKGYLLNGNVFDQTTGNNTIDFPLRNLIEGWQICIPLLEKGGEGTFYLPSELGYGSSAVGSIPANSVLVFDITLVNFN